VRRREAAGLIAAGVLSSRVADAQHQLHEIRKAPGKYTLQFFTPAEHRLLDLVADMIIPADDVSPGASAARVADYIDLVVANSSASAKDNWKRRIAAWDALARERHQGAFADLAADRRGALMDEASAHERSPRTDAEKFFADMKRMTLAGYYTSEIGLRQDLGFKGGAVLGSFPGCRHPKGTHG
jgi:hypothetical protein